MYNTCGKTECIHPQICIQIYLDLYPDSLIINKFGSILLNSVQVQVILRPTVSQPVLLISDFNFLCLTITFFPLHVGRPLWQEDGSVICSAITHWLESRRTHNHILLSHLRLPQPGGPGSCIYIPQEQGGPVIPPGTGFHLCLLLRLARLWWRYSNPSPHRAELCPSQSHVTTDSQSVTMSWRRVHSGTGTPVFIQSVEIIPHFPVIALSDSLVLS
jgi:hypothetical protein